MFDVPIAFVIFNRPEPTRLSFAQIRSARPKQLFLISDAPRRSHPSDVDLVAQTRRETESSIDWDCQVTKLYASENMGCGRRISSAITKAFESVEQLIILEDDCVPHASFFGYCDDLLQRYQDDQRIMTISGDNFQDNISRTQDSYYFSKYMHCWGWATWRRAWKHFATTLNDWPAFRDRGGLAAYCRSAHEIDYWTRIFDQCAAGSISSWAYPWQLSCWMNHGLTILPDVNLVSNVGFGRDATHTRKASSQSNMPTHDIMPIQHPQRVYRNQAADRYTDHKMYSQRISRFKRFRRKLGLTTSPIKPKRSNNQGELKCG